MATINESFPGPMSLAHTLNSRGELGMFVNPYACSCITCESVVQDWQAPVAFAPPPPTPAEMEAAEALLSLSGISLAPPPPPSLTRSITGFHYRPSDTGTLPADSPVPAAVPEEIVLKPEQAKTIAECLQEFVDILQERQLKLYDGPARSHDEMAARDMEFDEIDRKISEIDEILAVLSANE